VKSSKNMPRKFVRDSKFRHVFGDAFKKTACFEDIEVSKNSWDGGSYCAVNSKFLAVVLESCGGGAFIILKHDQNGRQAASAPRVIGHQGRVLDIQWNPFNTNVIASAAEDQLIKIWKIPNEGLSEDLVEAATELIGHTKKVSILQWHPAANNVLASASFDNTVIVWDVASGSAVHVLEMHTDQVFGMVWNSLGNLLATTSKDKKMRVIEPRTATVVHETECTQSTKPCRVTFITDTRLATVGFTKGTDREILLWDTEDLKEPLQQLDIDNGSANLFLYYDSDLRIMYVAGKGECSIRYYEVDDEDPYLHYLSAYSSNSPQRGFGFLPKRALDVSKCEIYRFYKLHTKGFVEPISMVVPRKSAGRFQSDLYPDVMGDTPALEAPDWFSGQDKPPIRVSLEGGFVPTEKDLKVDSVRSEKEITNISTIKAPSREEDLRKAFYEQQDELKTLKELLKTKQLRIKQLEYRLGVSSSEDVVSEDEKTVSNKKVNPEKISRMDSGACSNESGGEDEVVDIVVNTAEIAVK